MGNSVLGKFSVDFQSTKARILAEDRHWGRHVSSCFMLERASLRSVSDVKRMQSLGRKGGLAGGPARARALPPQRRVEIARRAARARWSRVVQTGGRPISHYQLVSFVAHHGSAVARGPRASQLETLAVRALQASRRDSALARMLPVFFWRLREQF